MKDIASAFKKVLGEPRRYAYKAEPVTLYLKTPGSDKFQLVKAYEVDFEIACDMYDIDMARGENCIPNPHLINIVEPGLHGDETNLYVSHSTILDEPTFQKLQEYTNNTGKLRCYSGVVEGYSISDIKKLFHRDDIEDTGVCLTDSIIGIQGLRYPDEPFDESRHKRYVQASESHVIKLKKKNAFQVSVRDVYQPDICKLSYNNLYEYC